MTRADPAFDVATREALRARYGTVNEVSRSKEVARLTPSYRAFIEAAPFVVIATAGPGGLDCSPRGDPAPVVAVVDDTTLLLPDRRGNNRLDSLENLITDPRIALLFLVPGATETMRVNGRARLSADPALLASFTIEGKAPALVVEIAIESVYFQCARALKRADLWAPEHTKPAVPSAGTMLAEAQTGFDGRGYDAELEARQRATLY